MRVQASSRRRGRLSNRKSSLGDRHGAVLFGGPHEGLRVGDVLQHVTAGLFRVSIVAAIPHRF
jgi:hypothetical protein